MISFRCNVCGERQRVEESLLGREVPSCASCSSTVRLRSVVHLLSLELFGESLALPDFPRLKDLRGLGLSDWEGYAGALEDRFDYSNTFYDREPRFDITSPGEDRHGRYDFLIASEVFEHVTPPVERAFASAARILKPAGVLILTVPYRPRAATEEHFPELHQFTLAELASATVLVNRRRDGSLEVFENLAFHGGHGSTLELRVFGERDLPGLLEQAGFRDVRVVTEGCLEFGIVFHEPWSLPVVARKEPLVYPKPLVSRLARGLTAANGALAQAQVQAEELHSANAALQDEVEARTRWARQLDSELEGARARIVQLQQELEDRSRWALKLESDLGHTVQLLDEARRNQQELEAMRRQVRQAACSRWLSLGRLFGLGPRFDPE